MLVAGIQGGQKMVLDRYPESRVTKDYKPHHMSTRNWGPPEEYVFFIAEPSLQDP